MMWLKLFIGSLSMISGTWIIINRFLCLENGCRQKTFHRMQLSQKPDLLFQGLDGRRKSIGKRFHRFVNTLMWRKLRWVANNGLKSTTRQCRPEQMLFITMRSSVMMRSAEENILRIWQVRTRMWRSTPQSLTQTISFINMFVAVELKNTMKLLSRCGKLCRIFRLVMCLL